MRNDMENEKVVKIFNNGMGRLKSLTLSIFTFALFLYAVQNENPLQNYPLFGLINIPMSENWQIRYYYESIIFILFMFFMMVIIMVHSFMKWDYIELYTDKIKCTKKTDFKRIKVVIKFNTITSLCYGKITYLPIPAMSGYYKIEIGYNNETESVVIYSNSLSQAEFAGIYELIKQRVSPEVIKEPRKRKGFLSSLFKRVSGRKGT